MVDNHDIPFAHPLFLLLLQPTTLPPPTDTISILHAKLEQPSPLGGRASKTEGARLLKDTSHAVWIWCQWEGARWWVGGGGEREEEQKGMGGSEKENGEESEEWGK
jgi:hypothetical protein